LKLVERVHERYVKERRVRTLASRLAPLFPRSASVLDVGCGDGRIAAEILRLRPDLSMAGLEVRARSDARIPVTTFDGHHLPFGNGQFDVVLFVDVLHHTTEPDELLREARRVGRKAVIIKDHDAQGPLAYPILRWMDRVGNARFAVALPHNYLRWSEWMRTFGQLGYTVDTVLRRLRIYPLPLSWVFDRSLHFIAVLRVSPAVS
jgi:SAM-dependent methyltransferase